MMKIIPKKIQSLFRYSLIYYVAALLTVSLAADERLNLKKQAWYWFGFYMINPNDIEAYTLFANRSKKAGVYDQMIDILKKAK